MYKKKNVLAIIPARSGSKGIKNKNIKKVYGKPLIYYTIKYAKKCKLIDKIIVSTDSEKYAKISRSFGALTPFLRSKKLAGDKIRDFPVIKDALNRCEKIYNKKFHFIIMLRPTSPFREKKLIERCIKKLVFYNGTSIRTVQLANQHPYRCWILNKKKKYIYGFKKKINEPYNMPRQILPKVFFQTGDLEIIIRKTLLEGSVSGNKVIPFFIKKKIYDIDSIRDLIEIKNK
jgi:N-acylneuraminate cytidylyltransferase